MQMQTQIQAQVHREIQAKAKAYKQPFTGQKVVERALGVVHGEEAQVMVTVMVTMTVMVKVVMVMVMEFVMAETKSSGKEMIT